MYELIHSGNEERETPSKKNTKSQNFAQYPFDTAVLSRNHLSDMTVLSPWVSFPPPGGFDC